MEKQELNENSEDELRGQMSFLEHLDELRRRLVSSVIIVFIAFAVCFYFVNNIFDFLAVPVQRALGAAQQTDVYVEGITNKEKITPLTSLQAGNKGKYVFEKETNFEGVRVGTGASVDAVVELDKEGNKGLYTNEAILTDGAVIPKGVKLPVNLNLPDIKELKNHEKLIVTTPMESFTLLITVSLYSAIAFSMPLLLLQVWGYISPALYAHERKYVTPFILLSSVSFIIGAAFGYYVLFPPAVGYLLGLGAVSNFNLMVRATDYFDFITLIMLAMGIIFQMPAITYVLSRIGLISAGLLIRSWKIAFIGILVIAAVASPTPDALNMLLFAAPMIVLYGVSIFVAWFFGKKRTAEPV